MGEGRFRTAAVLLATSLAMSGCQTLGTTGLITSVAYQSLSPEAATTIAADMVGRLGEHVGPGTSTIQLDNDGSVFGHALEASLRESGYAVATDQAVGGGGLVVPLAYVVDTFDGSVLARVSTPALNLTRIYALSAEGAVPASPVSVMTIGQGV